MVQKENKLKKISYVISLVCNISKIVLKVFVPFIVIAMILSFYIIGNIKEVDNKIVFETANIKLTEENDIKIYDVAVINIDEELTLNKIIDVLNNNSNTKIIIYVESGLLFLLISLILMIILLSYTEKLFNNIKNYNTPFAKENINLIKNISYLFIALIMVSPISETLVNYIFNLENQDNMFDVVSVLQILIIYSMKYIFEYGYNLEGRKMIKNGK